MRGKVAKFLGKYSAGTPNVKKILKKKWIATSRNRREALKQEIMALTGKSTSDKALS